METRLRTVATIVVMFVTVNGFSQRKLEIKPHFDEAHYLVCTCGNKIAKSKLAKNWKGEFQHTHAGVTCTLYEYEKCSNCGKTWIWHCMNSRPDDFTEKKVSVNDKNKMLHKAVEEKILVTHKKPEGSMPVRGYYK